MCQARYERSASGVVKARANEASPKSSTGVSGGHAAMTSAGAPMSSMRSPATANARERAASSPTALVKIRLDVTTVLDVPKPHCMLPSKGVAI